MSDIDAGNMQCSRCARTLGTEGFYWDPRRGTARMPCKGCQCASERIRRARPEVKESERAYKAANRHRHQEHSKRYRLRHPGAETERTRKWSAENPEKRRAHGMVWNEIRGGRLIKQPCEVCGEGPAHAHHDDYSRPTDVRWLCAIHHAEFHRNHAIRNPHSSAADPSRQTDTAGADSSPAPATNPTEQL
jgi:ribosomal protein S27AE